MVGLAATFLLCAAQAVTGFLAASPTTQLSSGAKLWSANEGYVSKPSEEAPAVAAPAAAAPAVAAATNAEWRAACDSTGVVSWHDFGVSL